MYCEKCKKPTFGFSSDDSLCNCPDIPIKKAKPVAMTLELQNYKLRLKNAELTEKLDRLQFINNDRKRHIGEKFELRARLREAWDIVELCANAGTSWEENGVNIEVTFRDAVEAARKYIKDNKKLKDEVWW